MQAARNHRECAAAGASESPLMRRAPRRQPSLASLWAAALLLAVSVAPLTGRAMDACAFSSKTSGAYTVPDPGGCRLTKMITLTSGDVLNISGNASAEPLNELKAAGGGPDDPRRHFLVTAGATLKLSHLKLTGGWAPFRTTCDDGLCLGTAANPVSSCEILACAKPVPPSGVYHIHQTGSAARSAGVRWSGTWNPLGGLCEIAI